jgi:hypothetical protein
MYDVGCQREIEASPEPGPPITVGLDGGYVRGRDRPPGGTACLEVIAGKSIPAGAIVNHGERYRCGERIWTGIVESTINQLVARFVKKQQMRWTPRGAHLLLQVRVHVLNNELGAAFQRWYPKFSTGQDARLVA